MSRIRYFGQGHYYDRGNGWIRGAFDSGEVFSAKVYDEGSEFGIADGRISKLQIITAEMAARLDWNLNDCLFNYDRGYDCFSPDGNRLAAQLVAAFDGIAYDKALEIIKANEGLGNDNQRQS